MLPRSAASTARSLARRNPSTSAAARLCTRSFASGNGSATNSNSSKLLDESILDHIVCPISKLPLRYDAARGLIICPEIRVAYPIVDGVPVLVPTEGRLLRHDEEV